MTPVARLVPWIAVLLLAVPAAAGDWRETADRALGLLDGSDDARTICMLKKIKDDGTDDRFVSDYYNVQQTAGGLPEDVSFDSFVDMISSKLRDQLGKDSLYPSDISDDDLRSGVRTYDNVIRRIFGFLNANVHQAGAGEAHKQLWNYILDQTKVSSSLYSCYSDTFIDER
jgi:hypothetical protein